MDDLDSLEQAMSGGDTSPTSRPDQDISAGYSGTVDDNGIFQWDGTGTPPLFVIDQHRRTTGVAGEASSFMGIYVTLGVGGGLVIMKGLARTGKDVLVNGVEAGVPDGFITEPPKEMTQSSFYGMHEEWNRARIHRHVDIVDLEDWYENALKMTAEGRSTEYEKHVGFDDDGNDIYRKQTINAPPSMVVFLADNNQRTSLDDFPELRDRGIVFNTDPTQEQNKRVIGLGALMAAGRFVRTLTTEQTDGLRNHVKSITAGVWDVENGRSPDFIHPYANGMYDMNEDGEPMSNDDHPVAPLFPESRMDGHQRFWKFINIVALWHNNDRITTSMDVGGETKERILVTPHDLWYGMRVYGEKLLMSSLNVGEMERHILWLLDETGESMTVAGISSSLQRAGLTAATSDVRSSCKQLAEKNYVNENADSGQRVEYHAAPFAAQVDDYRACDWDEVLATTDESIDWYVDNAGLEQRVADQYRETFIDPDPICTHPLSGRQVDITEYTAFQNLMEEKQNVLRKMVGKSAYEQSPEPESVGIDAESSEKMTEGLGAFSDD